MRLSQWIGPALALALLAGLPAAAATVTAIGNMGDGTVTELPDGRKLFTGDEIKIEPAVKLASGDDLELIVDDFTGMIGPYEIIFPGNRPRFAKESLHLEVNGRALTYFVFHLWYKDEDGVWRPYGGSDFKGDNETVAKIDSEMNVDETNLLGETTDVKIRGVKLLIRNASAGEMQITSVKIGVDSDGLMVATVPVPLPVALMGSGLGLLAMTRRRRKVATTA